MKAFQSRVGRKASPQATTSVIRCNMSSGDTHQNGEEYHQVKLIDANPLMMVGNNVLIRDDNGQESKVEFMPDYSAHDKCVRFGDVGTSSVYFQSLNAPACVLAVTTAENIVDKFKDHSKLHQFLYRAITEEAEQIKLTGVWLSKGENGEYKLRCGVYFDGVKRECKLDMSIRMLKLALMYDIPIYVHRDLLRHRRPILGRHVLESRRMTPRVATH